MKRKLILPLLFSLLFSGIGNSQILNVPQIIQEQNQWCWAGVSKCVLDYYGYNSYQQCDIADYARTVITWNNFGSVNCCVDPNQGCNYWNYNYGSPGSIQDILIHFGNIQNYGISSSLTTAEITTESTGNRPYIIRWGWYSGGGHFIVGHGISGSNVNYMNPWPGEGLHVSTYSWLVNDGTHDWTHTNVLTTAPTAIEENTSENNVTVFPNPANENFTVTLEAGTKIGDAYFTLVDVAGREVMKTKMEAEQAVINTSALGSGIYFYHLENDGVAVGNGKIIVE
jgi:hypothetical protein